MKNHDGTIFKYNQCKQSFKTNHHMKSHEKQKHSRNNEKVELLKYERKLVSNIQRQRSKLYENILSLKKKKTKKIQDANAKVGFVS